MGNPDQPTPPHIVDKLCETARNPRVHGYSTSRGIPGLRKAVCEWYDRRFGVGLDPETEVVAVIGSKEGLSHLALAILDPGDTVIMPSPTYPSHFYSVLIAGGHIYDIPLSEPGKFLSDLSQVTDRVFPKAKALIVSFPHNPTTQIVEMEFFEEIVRFAKKEGIIVVHDLAYSEICFDDYDAPSFLQVPGAKEVGVEFYSLSKTYNMAGWRVGFCVGNPEVVAALAKLKGYYDYGMYTAIQVAATAALRGDDTCITDMCRLYQKRRDTLVNGLIRAGWQVDLPKATMYVWARIPEQFQEMGSLKFCELLLEEGLVAVSPGMGFGTHGEGHVRFALVENEQRIRQAVRGIRRVLKG
jgi:alanine-synthesizing transaminase